MNISTKYKIEVQQLFLIHKFTTWHVVTFIINDLDQQPLIKHILNLYVLLFCICNCLIAIGDARHAAHDAQHVVVNRVDTDLGSVGSRNRGGRENKLEHSVVNAREVARPGRLVLLGPQGEGIDVDASVRRTRVVLERLDDIKVRSLTLGEAILSVELELGRDDGVLSPAVHVKGRLGEDEGAGIGEASGGSVASGLKSSA